MKILAFLIAAYTRVMLLIHVSTAKILRAWSGPAGSWMNRRFPPRRALRVEALYWALALAGWSLWPSSAWKTVVVLFGVIHLAIWLAGELNAIQLGNGAHVAGEATRGRRAIITFDLVEAFILAAVGALAVLYLLRT